MGLKTFPGGIHPHDHKNFSKDKKIETIPVPERIVIPLSQHIGAPAKPIVKVGDEVLAGQKIAEAGGFVSIPMHSSISGKVTKLDKFRHPTGALVQGIEITSDGEDKWIELIDDSNYMKLTAKDMKDRIAAATVANIIIVAPPRTDFGIC